jgi:hypothetical protein
LVQPSSVAVIFTPYSLSTNELQLNHTCGIVTHCMSPAATVWRLTSVANHTTKVFHYYSQFLNLCIFCGYL